jgi:hypothetical protein
VSFGQQFNKSPRFLDNSPSYPMGRDGMPNDDVEHLNDEREVEVFPPLTNYVSRFDYKEKKEDTP